MDSHGDDGESVAWKPEKPAKQNRGAFVRQKIAHQFQAGTERPAPGPHRLQSQLRHALSDLGSLTSQLCLFLAQPELDCDELQRMGFAAIRTCAQFLQSARTPAGRMPNASGMLVVSLGLGMGAAVECCQSLDELSTGAANIALLILPDEDVSETGEVEMQHARTFLESGADDIIILCGQQTVTAQRLQEAILRTEILAQKASLLMSQQVEAVKRKTSESLQGAWQKFMWEMPGKVLGNIPPMDPSISEHIEEQLGVGDYNFTCLLGSGTFGAVYRADHPMQGTRALKIMPKTSVKNIYQLFSVNTELCIMSNLAQHPNILQAFGALHTLGNIVLVMDHGGARNLHTFITDMGKTSGTNCLPIELIERFCRQAALAVVHLHDCMVCHRDLKPTNYVVSDDQSSLRLTDFGLSVLAFGPQQRLLHCCGSLPFAAPEVLRLQQKRAGVMTGPGYDGFAADIWSLAVNFVELCCGLYTTDRLLGWAPQPPADATQRLRDIENFEEIWRRAPPVAIPSMQKTLNRMFVLQASKRWTVNQVVGPEGMGLASASHRGSMPACLHGLAHGS